MVRHFLNPEACFDCKFLDWFINQWRTDLFLYWWVLLSRLFLTYSNEVFHVRVQSKKCFTKSKKLCSSYWRKLLDYKCVPVHFTILILLYFTESNASFYVFQVFCTKAAASPETLLLATWTLHVLSKRTHRLTRCRTKFLSHSRVYLRWTPTWLNESNICKITCVTLQCLVSHPSMFVCVTVHFYTTYQLLINHNCTPC